VGGCGREGVRVLLRTSPVCVEGRVLLRRTAQGVGGREGGRVLLRRAVPASHLHVIVASNLYRML